VTLTDARDEPPEAVLSVLPVRRLPGLGAGRESEARTFLGEAGLGGCGVTLLLAASSCLKKF